MISVRKKDNKGDHDLAQLLEVLSSISDSAAHCHDLSSFLNELLKSILKSTPFSWAAIYLSSDGNREPHLAASFTEKSEREPVISYELARLTLHNGNPIFANAEGQILSEGSTAEEAVLASYPLCFQRNIIAILQIGADSPGVFAGGQASTLETMSGMLAAGIVAARLSSESQSAAARLVRLNEFGSQILASQSLSQALDLTVRFVLEATQASFAIVYLLDSSGRLTFRFGLDEDGRPLPDEPPPRPEGLTRQIQLSNQPLVITGYETGDLDRIHPLLRAQGVKAFIGLPIKPAGSESIGVLYVRFLTPHDFSPAEIQGLQLYAAQAAGAIEYLRLLEESRRREVELGTMIDTSHMLISTLDMEDLLLQIAIRLTWVSGMDSCAISFFEADPDRLQLLAHYTGLGERRDELLEKNLFLEEAPAIQRILKNGEPVFTCSGSKDISSELNALLQRMEAASLLMLPIKAGGKPVGLLQLFGKRVGHRISQEDLMRFRAMSEQLALAVVNAHHYREEQWARLTAETLRRATSALNSTLELNQVLDLILDQLQQVVHLDSASLLLLEEDGFQVRAVYGHPHPNEALKSQFNDLEDSLFQWVLTHKEPLIIPDVRIDPRFMILNDYERVRCWMAVPLIHRDQVIGILTLDSCQEDIYSEQDASIALTFASHAALAVSNASLFKSEQKHRSLAEAMAEISLAISGSLKKNELLTILLEQIGRAVAYDSICVLLIEDGIAHVEGQRGFEQMADELTRASIYIDEIPPLRKIQDTLAPHYLSNVENADGLPSPGPFKKTGSWVGAPLTAQGHLLGFLSLNKQEPDYYQEEHAARLGYLASHASLALINAITYGQVEEASHTDFITNTFNHRYFHQKLHVELEQASRMGYPVSLLMIDLDRFKLFNDRYGHLSGDEILRVVAAIMKNELRSGDLLARYGGEEFAVVLPGTPGKAAMVVAERLRKAVERTPLRVRGMDSQVTISLGVATFPEHAQEARELVACADQALYQAKDLGRNQVYSAGMGGNERS